MTDRKISRFELITLNYFITRAFLIGFTLNTLLSFVKHDSWIIPIISIVPAILIIWLINYIMDYKTNLDIGEKIISLFRKKTGIIIIAILIIIIYILSVLNYLNLSSFIQSQFLNKTPFIAISIMFIVPTYYVLCKGINTITRTSNILFYIAISLLMISFIGLVPVIKLENIKPFLTSNISDYSNALNSFYSFNILPMVLLTAISKQKLINKKIRNYLVISYIVSAISIFLIVFQTIGVLGYELSSLYEYPEFFALKHFALVKISSRVESILVIQLILDIFIFNVFAIYFIGNNIKTIFSFKKLNIVYAVICVAMVIGSIFLLNYNTYIDSISSNIIPSVCSISITMIIVIICIKIKMSKN